MRQSMLFDCVQVGAAMVDANAFGLPVVPEV